ncbi:PAS domain S-box protein [Marinifilum sp. D714]|uniref:PAS domain S-box protein n=1 Tax=Marinifilum sp. D714 TaxID=2937523 RepID=UPI0027C323A4|nr:PAS domain S-box protein [Marinifilum sp. D714]MDQ2179859.1 PAS domain S-box protein [Marinifilum sp. D714]
MNDSILLGLIQNAAILLSFSIFCEYMWVNNKTKLNPLYRQVLFGGIIGAIGIILMMTSWRASSGIVFDTRSIILSVSGLFFGVIPTAITVLITSMYRFFMGGDGIAMGIAVIISSGTIGIIWRELLTRVGNQLKWIELLLMGFVVHIAMLFCTLLLPSEKIYSTLSYLVLPLLTIYPVVNMLLGLFMQRQMQNVKNRTTLSSTEEKYSRLYGSMSDAYFVMDTEYNILECNKALQDVLGYSEKDLLATNFKNITPEKWIHIDEKIIKNEVLLNGSSQVYEKECIKEDGTIVPVELRVHLMKDEQEEIVGYWSILRDISSRKNALQQIDNERARLETILQTVPEMIWLKSKDGKYLACNNNFAEFLGVKEEELIGKSDFVIFKNAEIADFYFKKDLEVIKSGDTIRFVNWVRSVKEDNKILTETIKTPMYDSNGNITGVLGVSRDISEIKKTEEELRKAKEKAEESDKLKSIFLANMSHEIRTPMNAIMGFSELLIDSEIEEVERMQYVNIIQQSGNRLVQIIDDIVDLSKLEMSQITLKKSDFYLFSLLKESLEIHKNRDLIKSKPNLELAIKLNPELEGLVLHSDYTRVQQVLDNLIENSIKFSDSGRVELGGTVIESNNQVFVEIYVKDNGIGIPKDRHEVIFERFRQGDEEHFIDGTGLGLSICKGLVELLGGTIRFESEVGVGSTFYFTIPVDKSKFPNRNNDLDNVKETIGSKKVLVAENDYNSFLYVKKLFDDQDVEVIFAENSTEMLDKLRQLSPDLLIMDLDIPGRDSMACLDEIKKSEISIKVIAQSTYVLKEEEEKCMSAGCDGYLTKPFSKEELFTQVRKALA